MMTPARQPRLDLPRLMGVMVLAWALLSLAADVAQAAQITLRSKAEVAQAGPVTLGDIATLEGDAAVALSAVTLGQLREGTLTLTRQEVRRSLDERGVNWGRLSLRGFTRCQVTLKMDSAATADTPPPSPVTAGPVVVLANPSQALDMQSPATLRDRLTQELVRHSGQAAGVAGDELRITFAARDEATLALGVLTDRWEVEIANAATLGRVLLVVRQWRQGRVVQTHRLSADVARRTLSAVAQRDLKRGELLADADVAIEEVFVTDTHHTPVTKRADAVGQMATQPIARGQVITRADVARPVLVRRGDKLMVRCLVGGLVIRVSARANEAGGLGDVVAVTNMDSNERFFARVVAAGQGMLVQAADAPSRTSTSDSKEGRP